jgi:hypothetical protein
MQCIKSFSFFCKCRRRRQLGFRVPNPTKTYCKSYLKTFLHLPTTAELPFAMKVAPKSNGSNTPVLFVLKNPLRGMCFIGFNIGSYFIAGVSRKLNSNYLGLG